MDRGQPHNFERKIAIRSKTHRKKGSSPETRQKGTLAKQIKTAIKSRRSWGHMVREYEHSRNHELYTRETLRHRTANMD